MVLVHELAHRKEGEHAEAFCPSGARTAPDGFPLEFDLRLYPKQSQG